MDKCSNYLCTFLLPLALLVSRAIWLVNSAKSLIFPSVLVSCMYPAMLVRLRQGSIHSQYIILQGLSSLF